MYHFLSECALRLGQKPHLVSLSDPNFSIYKKLEFNFPEQSEEVLNYLNINYHTVNHIKFLFNTKVQNGDKEIFYEMSFGKHGLIYLTFNDVHVSGHHMAFFMDILRYNIAEGYQPDATDDFVIPSCQIYDLAKEWMNVLQAEECWGGDTTEDFCPYFYGGNFYQYSDFRFRRSGPQYVDITLEDRTPYTSSEADEKMRKELRERGYDEAKIRSHSELWGCYGRIVDANWDEFYQMFKHGIKPPMRYADEFELYENADALFGDIKARAVAHEQLQHKLKSGELNYEEGFMTLD
jgi:hypothetical protein